VLRAEQEISQLIKGFGAKPGGAEGIKSAGRDHYRGVIIMPE
jgi:hypothetical protein